MITPNEATDKIKALSDSQRLDLVKTLLKARFGKKPTHLKAMKPAAIRSTLIQLAHVVFGPAPKDETAKTSRIITGQAEAFAKFGIK